MEWGVPSSGELILIITEPDVLLIWVDGFLLVDRKHLRLAGPPGNKNKTDACRPPSKRILMNYRPDFITDMPGIDIAHSSIDAGRRQIAQIG